LVELTFSPKEAVKSALIAVGMPVREAHRPHGRPSQSRFGRRRSRGREVDHQIEQRTIGIVKKMHTGGISLREIAACLTKMNIPTKNGSVKWHPQMIARIITKPD
jgi:hypothetical protein